LETDGGANVTIFEDNFCPGLDWGAHRGTAARPPQVTKSQVLHPVYINLQLFTPDRYSPTIPSTANKKHAYDEGKRKLFDRFKLLLARRLRT
jgi:hypothetical protein